MVVIISFLTLPTLSVSQSVLLASNVDFKSKCLSDFIGVKGSTPRMCSIYKSIIANKRQQRFSELFATFPTLGKMGQDQIVMLTNWITLTLISCIRTNWDSGWDSGILLGLMYLNIDESKVVLYLSRCLFSGQSMFRLASTPAVFAGNVIQVYTIASSAYNCSCPGFI